MNTQTLTNVSGTKETMIVKRNDGCGYDVYFNQVYVYKFSDTYSETQTDCMYRKTFASEKTAVKKAQAYLA
jgi:hypothetical protein